MQHTVKKDYNSRVTVFPELDFNTGCLQRLLNIEMQVSVLRQLDQMSQWEDTVQLEINQSDVMTDKLQMTNAVSKNSVHRT